jgi:uncharacterized protein (TIGR00297 family)
MLFGALLFVFGGQMNAFFLGIMVWFLLLSAIVTWIGKKRKSEMGVYEHGRSWKNVVANGIVPVFAAAMYYLSATLQLPYQNLLIVAYVASISAVAADKFSSELGVFGGKPTMLVTMEKTKEGVSGGVTIMGIIAGIVASMLVSMPILFIQLPNAAFYYMIIIASAFLGNIVDSILGYYENENIGNKYTSNAACSLVGFAVSIMLFYA